jgi:hypothetical protein
MAPIDSEPERVKPRSILIGRFRLPRGQSLRRRAMVAGETEYYGCEYDRVLDS